MLGLNTSEQQQEGGNLFLTVDPRLWNADSGERCLTKAFEVSPKKWLSCESVMDHCADFINTPPSAPGNL